MMQQHQPPPVPLQSQTAGTPGGVQVRCAGCAKILTLDAGVTEFACDHCQLPQMLPPELMTRAQDHAQAHPGPNKARTPPPPPLPPPHVAPHGVDPSKIQIPCANCKAILNVPHGLARFRCPQCQVDLAVDVSKLQQFFPPHLPLPPSPEEANELLQVKGLGLGANTVNYFCERLRPMYVRKFHCDGHCFFFGPKDWFH